MSTVFEAAEQCKAMLLEMREACKKRELAEHEAQVDREQRSLTKSARLDDLFNDLTHIAEGIQDIQENGPPSDGNVVSREDIAEIIKTVEENNRAQIAQLVAVLEGCTANHRRQQTELLRVKESQGRPDSKGDTETARPLSYEV
ncbi:hypothetical protein LshimejAT787_0503840 [Lyophyllum shimeji]|uniref:Uncharacterized protein n=1 Tax=Lyophyllum shimeji TaxID=47721 RepID=A0A9P3PN73_LYOSH|nr:hypothetical protein LshimejAT787_0503840 [Lyophyllum shimeji]